MIRIPMPRPGQVALAKEIEKLLRFLDASVERVVAVDPLTLEVTVRPGAGDALRAKIPAIVLDYVRGYKDFQPRVLATSEHKAAACALTHDFDDVEVAYGVRSKGPETYELFRFLIATFTRLYREFEPYRMSAPSMIARRDVERMGYFKKFPNLANFVVNLQNDYQLFKDVSASKVALDQGLLGHVQLSDKMLNPVTCYHVYPLARGLIERTGKRVFAIDGTAYRFESHNMSRTRLNEFHIQEIVFFGDKAEVERMRQTLLDRYVALLDRWEIDFEVESSSDVFYANDAASYIATQRFAQAKLEMNGKTDTGYHSFTSFNLHGDHYTKTFGLDAIGIEQSGCVGHGVERMMNVILSQHGADPEAWPGPLRDAFLAFRDAAL